MDSPFLLSHGKRRVDATPSMTDIPNQSHGKYFRDRWIMSHILVGGNHPASGSRACQEQLEIKA